MPTQKKRAFASPAPRRAKSPTVSVPGMVSDPHVSRADPAVIKFLGELEHPLKREIEAVRQIILGASPEIREGIKWNAPSFRTTEYFATFNLRTQDRIRLVLHLGAKVRDTATKGVTIADPTGLLEWLAKDRGLVTLRDAKDVQERKAALEALVREWIQWV